MIRKTIPLILLLFIFLVIPVEVKGEEGNVGFSVQALIPKNQIDFKKTYFDLRMVPGDQQMIEVMVFNNELDEIRVKATVRNATTNQNGLVIYDAISETDDSLKHPLTDTLRMVEEEIVIPSGESKKIKALITMPEEEYNGIILGGIHIEKISDEQNDAEKVQIQNKYVYVIGVQLSENDHLIDPVLNFISVEPKLINHRTAIQATIQNPQSILMSNLKAVGKVYKKKGNGLFKEGEKEVNMAPNSRFEFIIDWGNEPFQPGDYLLKMKMADDENEWKWEEPFTIDKDAELLNRNAVEIIQYNTKWFVIGIVGLICIIIVLMLYIRKLKKF